MSAKETAAVIAALVLTAGVIVVVGDEKPLDPQRDTVLEPSKLARLPDGGKGYVVAVRAADAGADLRITTADCVRRPERTPAVACMRQVPGDVPRDFGELNRFPLAWAVGLGCEAVACSVYAGEDSLRDEDAALVDVRLEPEVKP